MTVYALDDLVPSIDSTAWVHETATVVGNVMLAGDVGIWPSASLRGDLAEIKVGAASNIQDNAVLHTEPSSPCIVGEGVTVGHSAILHGCTIGNGSLVGMGACILNRSVIGENCLVGAGALITEDKTFPSGSLIIGSPARLLRALKPEEIQTMHANARAYVAQKDRYKKGARVIDPTDAISVKTR